MSFPLPPLGHPAHDWMDVRDIAVMLAPENRAKLPTLPEAIRRARDIGRDGMVRGCAMVVLHADDAIRLWQFGKRGGRKLLWTFRGPSV